MGKLTVILPSVAAGQCEWFEIIVDDKYNNYIGKTIYDMIISFNHPGYMGNRKTIVSCGANYRVGDYFTGKFHFIVYTILGISAAPNQTDIDISFWYR